MAMAIEQWAIVHAPGTLERPGVKTGHFVEKVAYGMIIWGEPPP